METKKNINFTTRSAAYKNAPNLESVDFYFCCKPNKICAE